MTESSAFVQGTRMDELLSRGLEKPLDGFQHNELVSRRYEELLERGARQGWLMSSSDIQLGAPIGAGTFGQTFAATWRGTRVRLVPPSPNQHLLSPPRVAGAGS